MRDPDRIESITHLIRRIWDHFPNWRYFQLMANIEAYIGFDRSNCGTVERFFFDDSTTEQALGDLLRKIQAGSGKWPDE